ncbi:NADPH-dependent FMN reductase [Microbacterium sp. NPDC056044]|uniref:NADPH-dependent FMN reductase n=1 Tax=Microbacterium sp. NPDC056044 TaxID=3345690 RepID=UPI0035D9C678
MKVLVIPGSARPNSVGNAVIAHVEGDLAAREGIEVTVATLDDISLPLLDTPVVPAFDDFVIEHDKVAAWTEKVGAADAFVLLVPEYNSSVTAIQKNSLDWVYKQWNGKRVAIVTYNFYEKKSAVEAITPVLNSLQLTIVEPIAGLRIGEEFAPDGAVLNEEAIVAKIGDAMSSLLELAPVS